MHDQQNVKTCHLHINARCVIPLVHPPSTQGLALYINENKWDVIT